MPWLSCTVEMESRRASQAVTGEFEGRSIYECAWAALCAWSQQWYFDTEASVITVRSGDRVWRVRQKRLREWRPLMGAEVAMRMLFEARTQDPEGRGVPSGDR